MDFTKENGGDWTKENPDRARDFDFSAFLDTDDLEERVTEALDGRDVLEPDAFGSSVAGYAPRRPGDPERGRHEAPTQTPAAQETASAPDPSDPRYAAPERPRVVVAQPRAKVYVEPDGGDEYDEPIRPSGGGSGGEALKWVLAVLVVIAVFGAALLFLLRGRGGGAAPEEAVPTPTFTFAADTTPAASATQTPAPTNTPVQNTAAPTVPPLASYTITVTAGSGGSVTPRGAVSVEEGGSVSFTITPNAGNELSQLLIDGVEAPLTDTYTFTDVTSGHTLYAVFRAAATPTPAPTEAPTPTPAPTPEPTPEPTAPPAAEDSDTEDLPGFDGP